MAHYRVTVRDVWQAHDEALQYGGRPGIRSPELIESAIARPYSGYHRRIHEKCAALLESLALNHGFIDGNKRTAVLAVDLLIRRSGYRYSGGPNVAGRVLEQLVLDVVEHRTGYAGAATTFRQLLRKR